MTATTDTPAPRSAQMPYGRRRLLLGVTAVGSTVVFALCALTAGLPQFVQDTLGSWRAIAVFFGVFALFHAGFDLLGGYLLPRWSSRRHNRLSVYAPYLLRGIVVHTLALVLIGQIMLTAPSLMGRAGFVAAAAVAILILLTLRAPIAYGVGSVRRRRGTTDEGYSLADAEDEGFTGGVLGVFRPGPILVPIEWRERLTPNGFDAVVSRRLLAVTSGSWRRGRLAALLFTLSGVTVIALGVPAPMVGTASGVIAFSLMFTLWSFVGLLLLPSVSRAASHRLDQITIAAGISRKDLTDATRTLDNLQDAEPQRGRWIERVFHPIPSVERRMTSDASGDVVPGAWDTARTAIYLSWSGLSLVSRSVHCNCGRPALWVFLPIE